MYDPIAEYDRRINSMYDDPFSQRKKAAIQPFKDPQEEDSLLGSALGKTLGGIGYVGGVLDKTFGGRAIRGVLGGKPEEALSVIPGSDTLGLTDESNRVSGEDLAKKWGLLEGDGEKGTFEARDLLGPAIEMGLDPATYLTLGGSAVSKAGKVASKIGILPKTATGRVTGTLRELLRESPEYARDAVTAAKSAGHRLSDIADMPLGGLAGFGLPFSEPSVLLGTGQSGVNAMNAAGKVASTVGKWTGLSPVWNAAKPIVEPLQRGWTAMFDPDVRGATSVAGQEAGRQMSKQLDRLNAATRGNVAQATRTLHNANVLDQGPVMRDIAEGLNTGVPLQNADTIRDVAGNLKSHLDKQQVWKKKLGGIAGDLEDDYINYFPRHELELDRDTRGFSSRSKALPTSPSELSGRNEAFTNLPFGSEQYNQLSVDPQFSGIRSRLQPGALPAAIDRNAQHITTNILGMTPADDWRLTNLKALRSSGYGLTTAMEEELAKLQGKVDQGDILARHLAEMDPKRALENKPFYGNHPVQDYQITSQGNNKAIASMDAIHDMFAKYAEPGGKPGWIRYDDALKQAGIPGTKVSLPESLSRLDKFGKSGVTDLKNMYLPPDIVGDAARFVSGHQTPEALKPLLKAFDSITNLTKAYQTAFFPGFHVRNAISGQWQNFVLGAHDPRYAALDPRRWSQPIMDARNLLTKSEVAGASEIPFLKGLSDKEAADKISDWAFQHRVTGAPMQGGDVLSTGAQQAEHLTKALPGIRPASLWEDFKTVVPKSGAEAWPLNVSGVGGANKDQFSLVAAGRKIGGQVEDTNRLSAFIGMLRQGYSPEQAAARVRAAHVDYAHLSDFEKSTMRRLIPFYTYSRGTIPFVLSEMAQHPGGISGQAARLTNDMRDQAGFVPPYLGSGLAIPMGQEEDGKQRFLTKLDLPHEQAFEQIHAGPKATERTLMSLLGQTNPLIKAPLEFATGKQFYTGRDLDDLYTPLGTSEAEQFLINSPFGRAYTTGKQIADPRKDLLTKAINLGTGLKISDVDMARQRDIAGREVTNDLLRGRPGIKHFESMYVKPEDMGMLDPDEIMLLRLNKTLEMRARDQARQRRLAAGQ